MGRIRLRKIVNEQGQCARCDVYVVLPVGKNDDAIVDHIRKKLPGIQAVAWPKAAYIRIVLDWTRARPESASKLTLDKSGVWLRELEADWRSNAAGLPEAA